MSTISATGPMTATDRKDAQDFLTTMSRGGMYPLCAEFQQYFGGFKGLTSVQTKSSRVYVTDQCPTSGFDQVPWIVTESIYSRDDRPVFTLKEWKSESRSYDMYDSRIHDDISTVKTADSDLQGDFAHTHELRYCSTPFLKLEFTLIPQTTEVPPKMEVPDCDEDTVIV